jgi:hypothetical protein
VVFSLDLMDVKESLDLKIHKMCIKIISAIQASLLMGDAISITFSSKILTIKL